MAGIVVQPRARIFHGHEWVFAYEVKKAFGNPQPGEVIALKDFKDRRIGSAIYNPQSQIVARRFSRRKQDLDGDFFLRRLGLAAETRERLGIPAEARRLVWSESDGLPGVIIDQFGPHLVLQTLTLAMDQRKGLLKEALVELFQPESIVERNDSTIREAEGLERLTGMLHGETPPPFHCEIAGIHYTLDLADGQKTGFYLDQVENHLKAAGHARGRRVLDAFCNQGGFGLQAKKAGASSVFAIDSSESAVAAGRANSMANLLEIDFEVANVFDRLRQFEEDQFDYIILDPPTFSRSRKALKDALRGYKEIHLRALRILKPGGLLATFSCSHHVSRSDFLQNIREASVDAKRSLRLLETFGQRLDHPVLPTLPESEYLKGFLLEVCPSW
ncbi:MAG: class I SAM-dependent rRNA methyltransferase [Verrucomicrobiota bacterium]